MVSTYTVMQSCLLVHFFWLPRVISICFFCMFMNPKFTLVYGIINCLFLSVDEIRCPHWGGEVNSLWCWWIQSCSRNLLATDQRVFKDDTLLVLFSCIPKLYILWWPTTIPIDFMGYIQLIPNMWNQRTMYTGLCSCC